MKRHTVFIIFFIALQLKSSAQAFLIANPGGNNDATQISCDYYQLTPNVSFEQGAIWYRQQLNLSNPFDYKFDLFLGANNGQGADGMAFVIQNQGQGLGPQGSFGSQLGYATLPGKSLAVEFDTHGNGPGLPYGDIPEHHIAIDTGGVQFPTAAGPVTALASGGNIDDGNWHTAEITWVPATQTMTVYFDGAVRLTCTFTGGLAASVFNNQNLLYWGWTGASGSKYNTQQIRIPLQADFVSGVNYAQCGLSNVAFADSSTSGLNNLSYLWNFADGNTSTQQNVSHSYTASGVYYVKLTVTDGGTCTSDTVIPVSVYSVPVITPTQTNVTCFNAANGIAHANVTNGTPAYTYNWAPAVSTVNNAAGLAPGIYNLTVVDHNGCRDSTTFTITQPPALTDSLVQVNVLCNGQSTGSVTAIAGGGTPAYNYTWSPNANSTTSTANNLPAGTYTSTITDANGCTVTKSAAITEPALLTASIIDSNVRCYSAATGYVIITGSGGTRAYNYTWSPNGISNDSAAINIPAGNYSVTLTDAHGCSVTESATITQPASALTLSATAIPVLCYGYPTGTIIATAGGGTPVYNYQLSSGESVVSNDSVHFNHLLPMAYTVTVTDMQQCSLDTTVIVDQPAQLVIDSTPVISPLCYGYHDGQIKVSASGGTPGFTYAFSSGVNNNDSIAKNLVAGTYAVTVTDHSGCTAVASDIILTQPDSVLIEVTPTPVQVVLGDQLQLGTITNQNGTVTYNWKPEFGLSCYDCPDPVFNGVFSQPYKLTITNQNGCSGTAPFVVDVVPEYNLFFPNAFVPAGANSTWQLFGKTNAVLQFHVAVFDRAGEKVFESNAVNFKWDGTYKGQPAPMGVYTYLSRVVWINDYTEKLFEGTITLLR